MNDLLVFFNGKRVHGGIQFIPLRRGDFAVVPGAQVGYGNFAVFAGGFGCNDVFVAVHDLEHGACKRCFAVCIDFADFECAANQRVFKLDGYTAFGGQCDRLRFRLTVGGRRADLGHGVLNRCARAVAEDRQLADFGCTVVVRFDGYTPVIGISRDFECEAALFSVFGGLLNDQFTVIDAFCLKTQIGGNGGLLTRKSRHALNSAVCAFPNGNGIGVPDGVACRISHNAIRELLLRCDGEFISAAGEIHAA